MLSPYAKVFMVFASILATIVGFIRRRKHPQLKHLYLYPLASFVEATMADLYYDPEQGIWLYDLIAKASSNIFLMVEFSVVYIIFWRELLLLVKKRVIKLIAIANTANNLVDLVIHPGSYGSLSHLFLVQSIVCLPPVILYFVNQFYNPTTGKLIKDPKFWVAMGFVLYFSCTMPLFLMDDFIFNPNTGKTAGGVYAINYLSYGILFLLIVVGYGCKKVDAVLLNK